MVSQLKNSSSSFVLDAFDRAILRLVQRDNKMPQREIADKVNLSAASVQRRVKAMEDAGIIARNVAVVEPDVIHATITAITEVQLRDEKAATVDKAKAMFKNEPEIQQCYYVTGGISFVLIVVSADMRAYEAFTRRMFAENDLVSNFRSLIALDRVKSGTEILIPE